MKKDIKMLMFDLDGTLIDYDCKMSLKTVESLKKCKKKGYLLALNSGRPIHLSKASYMAYLDEDFFDYISGCNGIEFYDTKQKSYELLNKLSSDLMKEIGNLFKMDELTLGYYDGYHIYINQAYDDKDKDYWMETHFVTPIVIDYQSISKDYPKIIGIFNKKDRDKVQRKMETIQDERIDFYFSSPMVMEIIPKGATKKDAVLKLEEKLQLKKENILAFGDSHNDLPMLKHTTSVAMANAAIEVIEACQYKTESVVEDGIYHFLVNEDFIDE